MNRGAASDTVEDTDTRTAFEFERQGTAPRASHYRRLGAGAGAAASCNTPLRFRVNSLPGNPLVQLHGHTFTGLFSNRIPNGCLYGQHVSTVTHGHEGTFKWVTIDRSPNPYQAASTKKPNRPRPDHVRPTTFIGALPQNSVKALA